MNVHQPTNITGKSTIDTWNDLSTITIKRNEQINPKPIHIDSHSNINTWSDDIKQPKSSRSFIDEKTITIDFDHAKPTVDDWNEEVSLI